MNFHVNSGDINGNSNNINNNNNIKNSDVVNGLLLEMKENIVNGIKCVDNCKWLIIITSCLFITLLSWDIVGDKKRWDGSYWIPLIGIGIMIILLFIDYYYMIILYSNN